MNLRISDDLKLPRDTVTSTIVVYGGKGMGKTNLGGVVVEELTKAGLRWSVLDPLGVWWGLRHSKDGRGPGIECLILGGPHGDIPIEPTGGAVIADLVVEESVNVVIDISRRPNGKMWERGERIRFVTDYALRLFQRQGDVDEHGRRRAALLQIVDEAARYIPQIIPSGAIDIAKCVGAWEQIVEEGRNIGLGSMLLTQRSARMNKSVSELADAMISFRIVGPLSINAVMDWLGEHVEKSRWKALIEQLRQLERGHALVISPGWLKFEGVVPIRMRETFDSSATPEPGEHRREPKRAAKPDLEKYKARMAETIERAKQDDPRELRRRIADLEKQIATKRSPATAAPPPAKLVIDRDALARAVRAADDRTMRAAVAAAEVAWRESNEQQAAKYRTSIRERLTRVLQRLTDGLRAALKIIEDIDLDDLVPPVASTGSLRKGHAEQPLRHEMVPLRSLAIKPPAPPTPATQSPRDDDTERTVAASDGALGKAGYAILGVLKRYPTRTAAQLAWLAGYHARSKGFLNALSALRTAGYITGGGQEISATPEGGAAAEGRDVFDGPRLSATERTILNILAHFDRLAQVRLALLSECHARGRGFMNALSRLRTLGLLEGAPGALSITEEGKRILDDLGGTITVPGAPLRWLEKLGKTEREIVTCLLAKDGATVARAELAGECGCHERGKGFLNALSTLRTLGFIEGSAELRAHEDLVA